MRLIGSFFIYLRGWDPSNRLRAAIRSNLPQELSKSIEYAPKNSLLTFPSYICYFFKIRQTPIFRFHGSRHLVRHLLLQSTPLDPHRKMSMLDIYNSIKLWNERRVMPKTVSKPNYSGEYVDSKNQYSSYLLIFLFLRNLTLWKGSSIFFKRMIPHPKPLKGLQGTESFHE